MGRFETIAQQLIQSHMGGSGRQKRTYIMPDELALRAGESSKQDGVIGMVRGYASVVDQMTTLYSWDSGELREVIRPGAFKKSIDAKKDVRAFLGHDSVRLLGRTSAGTLRLREDDKGLYDEIDLPDTSDGRDAKTNIDLRNLTQQSFGFFPTKTKQYSETVRKDGVARTIYTREVLEVDLVEVSLVSIPAYSGTSIKTNAAPDAGSGPAIVLAEGVTGVSETQLRSLLEGFELRGGDEDGDDSSRITGALAKAKLRMEKLRVAALLQGVVLTGRKV